MEDCNCETKNDSTSIIDVAKVVVDYYFNNNFNNRYGSLSSPKLDFILFLIQVRFKKFFESDICFEKAAFVVSFPTFLTLHKIAKNEMCVNKKDFSIGKEVTEEKRSFIEAEAKKLIGFTAFELWNFEEIQKVLSFFFK